MVVLVEPHNRLLLDLSAFDEVRRDQVIVISKEGRPVQKWYDQVKVDLKNDLDSGIDALSGFGKEIETVFATEEKFLREAFLLRRHFGISHLDNEIPIRNKAQMRERHNRVASNPIEFTRIRDAHGDISRFRYPVVVKLNHGYSSLGVYIASDREELATSLKRISRVCYSLQLPFDCLVEPYINGEEYAVETMWQNGRVISSFVIKRNGYGVESVADTLYFSCPNPPLEHEQAIECFVLNELSQLRPNCGVTHAEVKINDNGLHLIEVSNRPGGGGLLYRRLLQGQHPSSLETFYKCHKTDVELFPAKQDLLEDECCSFLIILPVSAAGRVSRVSGLDRISSRPEVIDVIPFLAPGDYVSRLFDSVGYAFWVFGRISMSDQRQLAQFREFYESQLEVEYMS